MTTSERKKIVQTNTCYWLVAMLLPLFLHIWSVSFVSESTKFPWPILMPGLLIGPMTQSNALLKRAMAGVQEERSAE